MFTKPQLTFLIDSQYGEDWSAKYFVQTISDLAYDCDQLSDAEHEELFAILGSYSIEQVEKLQIALAYLGDLTE
jgi:hypothetical protein